VTVGAARHTNPCCGVSEQGVLLVLLHYSVIARLSEKNPILAQQRRPILPKPSPTGRAESARCLQLRRVGGQPHRPGG
jgi:hypothetical protein